MAKEIRQDRFSWGAGEASVSLSQCGDCKNNTGLGECKVYGSKPEQYAVNKEQCLERLPE